MPSEINALAAPYSNSASIGASDRVVGDALQLAAAEPGTGATPDLGAALRWLAVAAVGEPNVRKDARAAIHSAVLPLLEDHVQYRKDTDDHERKRNPSRSAALRRRNRPLTCGDAVLVDCGRRSVLRAFANQSEPIPSPPVIGLRRSQTTAAKAGSCRLKRWGHPQGIGVNPRRLDSRATSFLLALRFKLLRTACSVSGVQKISRCSRALVMAV